MTQRNKDRPMKIDLQPCPICGATPEQDWGFEDAPHDQPYITCPTVHIKGDFTASCPVSAGSPEEWNLFCDVARKNSAKIDQKQGE